MKFVLTEEDIQKVSEAIVENFRIKARKEGDFGIYGRVMDSLQQMIPHHIKKHSKKLDDKDIKTSSIHERKRDMSNEREELVFASTDEALQHLANITGEKIMIAKRNTKTFKCPDCGTKVLDQTKYCVKCKKKVENKGAKKPVEDKGDKKPVESKGAKKKVKGK